MTKKFQKSFTIANMRRLRASRFGNPKWELILIPTYGTDTTPIFAETETNSSLGYALSYWNMNDSVFATYRLSKRGCIIITDIFFSRNQEEQA